MKPADVTDENKQVDMLDGAALAELVRFAAQHDVTELEWETGGKRVLLKLKPARGTVARREIEVPEVQSALPKTENVQAQDFGLFSASANPVITNGDRVKRGQILGFIRIGPVLQAVRSPCDGIVSAFNRVEGDLIGYGDIVFEIMPQQGEGS